MTPYCLQNNVVMGAFLIGWARSLRSHYDPGSDPTKTI